MRFVEVSREGDAICKFREFILWEYRVSDHYLRTFLVERDLRPQDRSFKLLFPCIQISRRVEEIRIFTTLSNLQNIEY